LSENLRRRDNLEKLIIDGRTILKLISEDHAPVFISPRFLYFYEMISEDQSKP